MGTVDLSNLYLHIDLSVCTCMNMANSWLLLIHILRVLALRARGSRVQHGSLYSCRLRYLAVEVAAGQARLRIEESATLGTAKPYE